MAQVEERIIHQALFGYSDGHRLIESSVRFSSRELYDLSAVSDLATGVQLRSDETYLTGTPLQDSRYFALIRTWPAPEMPRPGCVWSHVLLLTPEVLASHGDLGGLSELFLHPRSGNAPGAYSKPLDVGEGKRPDSFPGMVADVVRSYYRGRSFPVTVPVGSELDGAVLAVWSQQWPKLRAAFSFRTIRTKTSTSRGSARFEFQPSPHQETVGDAALSAGADGSDLDWVNAAVEDATSSKVTPLRRFLWRYGKDVRAPRQRFQNLVKMHLATRELPPNCLPLSWAKSVASLFPGVDNAVTLKRDMLGFELTPLALCPAVAHEDVLELIAGLGADSSGVTEQNLETRLSKAPSAAVPALVVSLGQHPAELAEHTDVILRVLTKISDGQSIVDTRISPSIRMTILKGRHDLISQASLAAITEEDLLQLFDEVEEEASRSEIIDVALSRDQAVYPDHLINQHAAELVLRAIAAREVGALSNAATTVFRTRARELVSSGALDRVAGAYMAAKAADLLHYPVDEELAGDIPRWLSALDRPGPSADGQLLAGFEAYMYVVAIKGRTPAAWELIRRTLPGLRSAVLAGSLANSTHDLLDARLPPNGWNSWDFDKRILIGLRDLRRWTGADSAVVEQLCLPEEDMEFVLDDRKNKKRDKGGSIFWPFG